MQRHRLSCFLLAVALGSSACSGDDPDDPGGTAIDLNVIKRGAWRVEITTVVDICMPRGITGSYLGAVTDGESGIRIFVPEKVMGEGVLGRPIEFVSPTLAYSIPGQQENCVSGGHRRQIDITRAEADAIDMTVTDDWMNLFQCEEGGVAPLGDCHAERSFAYSLVVECEPPCEIISTEDEAMPRVCDCSGGGM